MFLQNLRLYNFKNYEELSLDLGKHMYCFFGNNGSGKTNLLDAIYYLSFTKSSISASDSFVVRKDQHQFLVKGVFESEGRTAEVVCSSVNGKKTVQVDGQGYQKFSDHLGRFPVVLVAPQDIELIWDGSELRRKFFDSLISQLDKNYLDYLIVYTHQLKQRNSFLRMTAEAGRGLDRDLLDSYDHRLMAAGSYLFQKRKEFLATFLPIFHTHYHFLSDGAKEKVSIEYESDLHHIDFGTLLKKNREKDILLQRTTSGIHRDDFFFSLDGSDLKRTGSQGQQKSFLIGLKLTEFQIIAENKQTKPILLLDDIFDKLDDQRIHKLMQLVAKGNFGQIFLTDARPARSEEILINAGLQATMYRVENGQIR